MQNEQFFSFDFLPSQKSKLPHLDWLNRPKKRFKVSKIKLKEIIRINSKEILSNITSNITKIQKNKKNDKSNNKNKALKDLERLNLSSLDYCEFCPDLQSDWINKIVHGDSLMGMAHLIKNGLQKKIQMVFMDPPFGIDFNANFQSGSQKAEGYIDSWNNGLSSYLEYLRERIVLIRELLRNEGSVFIQIGEKNLHYVRCIMDEIFGKENFISQITFRTAISTNNIKGIADYLLWYARDKSQVFRRKLFFKRPLSKVKKTFTYTDENGKDFKPQELVKRKKNAENIRFDRIYSITYKGKKFKPPSGFEWRWQKEALERLVKLNRVFEINAKLYGKRFEKDFPVMILTNVWNDTSTSTYASRRHYSVHTNPKVIKRCIAMTTKAGDLVLDPTSGSGTTAVVAEKMYRRWIVFDTSSTSVLSTMSWLLGSLFDTYKISKKNKDIVYKSFSKKSISKLAHNLPSPEQFRYEIPKIDKKKSRVVSPFSIEIIEHFYEDRLIKNFIDKFPSIIENNGILLPSGKTIEISKIYRKKSYLIESPFESFKVDISNRPWTIILSPSAKFAKSDQFINFIDKLLDKSRQKQNIIIISSSFNPKLFEKFNKNKNLEENHILYGIINPDLYIKELNYINHPECFKLLGKIEKKRDISTDNKDNIVTNYFNPLEYKKKSLLIKDMAILGNFSDVDKDKIKKVIFLQLPIYKKYISKLLKEYYCNNQIELSNKNLFWIDYFGTSMFA